MKKNNATVALFGGSFDPPHIGHEAITEALLRLDFIDEVVVMPTFLNPFKESSFASADMRLKWLREIYFPYEKVSVSNFEVSQNRKIASIESVQHLLKSYDKIYLVIGADNLKDLHKWYKFDELNNLVKFIVASRDNISVPNNFINLKIDENISSSELRNNLREDKLSKINSNEIIQYYKENNE